MKKHFSKWWDRRKKSLSAGLTHYQFDNTYFYDQGRAVWSERDYQSFANQAYTRNVIAYRAINMIAQSAACVPLTLMRRGVPVLEHSMLDLLKRPNPSYSGRELLEQVYVYRMISGNAYILAIAEDDSPPTELIALRPDRVQLLSGKAFMPLGYRYTVGSRHTDYHVDQVSGRCAMLHIKNFHPLSDWYGLSSVEAAAYSIDQHNQAGAWNQALLQNGARPSGTLTVHGWNKEPRMLTEEQHQRLKAMIDETFSGSQNAGRPMLLEGGLEWKEMGLSPKDMDYITAKHSAARDIALAFGMPPQLLGIPGDNTYSNLAEARLALWEQTILPLVEHTVEALNHWLKPYFADDVELSYDLEQVPAMAERRSKLWEQITGAEFMTINEKRAALGLSPLPGGDTLTGV